MEGGEGKAGEGEKGSTRRVRWLCASCPGVDAACVHLCVCVCVCVRVCVCACVRACVHAGAAPSASSSTINLPVD